ncbi:Vascular cell adhesion protein 1 [Channa argus]|uniref:Vascular cell adhesion protein 1 n=1 Tax=Channa argus TaxID=215402 RepID=A0A6G1QCH8_CHAAH|nr:Vascular cell adhesion protein 1 [Channa argus]
MLGLLIHVFLLSDVVSACPEDLNPLSLDPPMVVEQFGREYMVNCTSKTNDHEGMYWYDETGNSDLENERNFLAKSVSLSNWNVTATCKIKLKSSLECSRDVEITVYKNPDVVTLHPINPENTMVEGKQYELLCDIASVAPVRNLSVTWYKDEQIVKTSYFTNTTKIPLNVSSILPVTMSRGKNEVKFRCEAQLDFKDQSPVSSDIIKVFMHYAPEFNNKTSDVLNVQEGANVTLNCEADGNPAPVYYWNSGEGMATYNLTIAKVHADVTYNCTAANSLGIITKEIHVNVMKTLTTPTAVMTTPDASAPKEDLCPITLTPDTLVVRFGDSARVNCSTLTPEFGMGWEAVIGGTPITDSSFVTWEVEKLEIWKPEPLCFINLNHTQCTVKPAIIVYKLPDSVSVSAVVPGPMVEGNEYQLRCDIFNVAPRQNVTVKWYQGSENVAIHTFNDTMNNSSPLGNVSHTWKLMAGRDNHGKHFTCKAELYLGPQGPKPIPTVTSDSYTAVVYYKPVRGACQSHFAGVERNFSVNMLSCQVDGNPAPTIYWSYQGKQINASEPLTRSQSGIYTAEMKNHLGSINTSVDITVEYGPIFTCNDYYEVEENDEPQRVMCEAQGIPTPNITWFKGGQKMGSLVHWTKGDSGKYLLEASNKHGTVNHTLHLNVSYAPTFKQQNEKMGMKEISMGGNVTFECHAEGNPAPEIHWHFTHADNVFVTTWGSHMTITIREATSTNAGDYICVATNKVGNATRSFTLKIQGEISEWWKFPLIVLIIISILIIIIVIIIVLYKKSKKYGQYSFINANNGQLIPLNGMSTGNKV